MSVKKEDFLVEIHTEELPPKALKRLGVSFLNEISARLVKAQFLFERAEYFATPRRLAVLVTSLVSQQPETQVERRGPARDAAFDSAGNPSQACIGFARSCGVTPDKLSTITNAQGEWVGFQQTIPGKSVTELLPVIIQESLAALPIPKRMRWGSNAAEFVRPVHSIIMLYGNNVIDAEILGISSGRQTQGHRFHCQETLTIAAPENYEGELEKNGFVIANFERRQAMIVRQTEALVKKIFGDDVKALMPNELVEEVAGLVEWPVAILGNFDKRFLEVPSEALISAMQDHQRYFAVIDANGNLMPHFVTVSNINSQNEKQVVAGNERVLRARLSDAAFFFETDKKRKLADRLDALKEVVYQAKLGSVFEKANRIAKLSNYIAKTLNEDVNQAERAGLLAKADLTTSMVGEFPELQGIAGCYYATHDGESSAIATAIREQYLPRFSGDEVPKTKLGCAVALADRIDTLIGIFGINQAPTGDKDPLGLRRAALGVLRILIENQLNIDLRDLLQCAADSYGDRLENKVVVDQVLSFVLERLKPWYQEQNINPDVFASVIALGVTRPYDIHRRIEAVQHFKQLPDAESLSVANKRVSNILAKYEGELEIKEVNKALFENDAERELSSQLDSQKIAIAPMYLEGRYVDVLSQLSDLRQPVDHFFDKVMVMTDDKAQRENRLLLLTKLRSLFLQVADIALLQARQ